MASLAEINQTLKKQTQVLAKEETLEDNNKRVVDLQDRLQKFITKDERQAGDRREKEIEEARKKSREAISARPRGLAAGFSRGLGLDGAGGLLNSLSEKLFGALGIAAGAVGIGAAKLLKGGLAYAALSDFAEKAIASTIQNIDDKYLDFDLTEKQKENITEGAQTAIAARLLGIKSPLGLAAAGVIGAWGDEVIAHINKEYGNEDGTYNIAGMEIDTNSEGFVNALGITAALVAPRLLKTIGKGLLFALRKFPAVRLATVLAGSVGAMLGIKSAAAGTPGLDDADPRNKPGAYDSGSRGKKVTIQTGPVVAGAPDQPRIIEVKSDTVPKSAKQIAADMKPPANLPKPISVPTAANVIPIDRTPITFDSKPNVMMDSPNMSPAANVDRAPVTPKSIANDAYIKSLQTKQKVPLKLPQVEQGLKNMAAAIRSAQGVVTNSTIMQNIRNNQVTNNAAARGSSRVSQGLRNMAAAVQNAQGSVTNSTLVQNIRNSPATKVATSFGKQALKVVEPALLGYSAYTGFNDPAMREAGMNAPDRIATQITTDAISLADLPAQFSNLVNTGINKLLGTDLKTDYATDFAGDFKRRSIENDKLRQESWKMWQDGITQIVNQNTELARRGQISAYESRGGFGPSMSESELRAQGAMTPMPNPNLELQEKVNSFQPITIINNNIDNSTTDNSSNNSSSIVSTGNNADTFSLVQ